MAVAERRANVVWRGNLQRGSGTFDLTSSEAAQGLPVTWASRTERPDGKTSPEELIAAAHASCFAMAFSNTLAEQGNDPEELDISAVCTFDADQLKITTMVLDVRGTRPRRRGIPECRRAGRAGLSGLQRLAWQRGHSGQREPGLAPFF
jgi:osmotically inducible protein OsmC